MIIGYYEIRYCLNCSKLQVIVNTMGHRYCHDCLKQNIAECPPPEMTDEQWEVILGSEEIVNE